MTLASAERANRKCMRRAGMPGFCHCAAGRAISGDAWIANPPALP
jgi:hypothetical protein